MSAARSVASLMRQPPWTIDLDVTLSEIEREFASRGIAWAPVADDQHVIVGVISAIDLLQAHALGRDPDTTSAWQLCSYRPIAVDLHAPLSEVARQMVERHVHHVVVTDHGAVAGVLSSLDFVRSFIDDAG